MMKTNRSFLKLIFPVIVASTVLANGKSINSKISNEKVLQSSEFGDRITSGQRPYGHSSEQNFNEVSISTTVSELIDDTKIGNNTIGASPETESFDSKHQGEQSFTNNNNPERGNQSKQEHSTDQEYTSEEPTSQEEQHYVVKTAKNSSSHVNATQESEDFNWHIEGTKSESEQPNHNPSRLTTTQTTSGSTIDISLIRNLTEGLFPIKQISNAALDGLFPVSFRNSNIINQYQVGLDSPNRYLEHVNDRAEFEKSNSTNQLDLSENIPEHYSHSLPTKSVKLQTSLANSFYSKPSKRVERKSSLVDLIGSSKSKPIRDISVAQSTISISKPEIFNDHDTKVGKSGVEADEINQRAPMTPLASSNQMSLPKDHFSFPDFFSTISPGYKSASTKDEQTAASSNGGLVEKDTSFEFEQQTPSNNGNQNILEKIVYHSTPLRPSNNNSNINNNFGFSANTSLIQQSQKVLFRSEPPKEKPVVSFAAPNESNLKYTKLSNQQMRDEIHRNDPRGASASARSESSIAKTSGSKDQPIKIGLADSSKKKDYSSDAKFNQKSEGSQAVSELAPLTRKEKLMFDLYERDIDQQIAQALYREMQKSAEILVKSATAATTSTPIPMNNKLLSQSQIAGSFHRGQSISWPSQASLPAQVSDPLLNPTHTEYIQPAPESYQELPSLSSSDLEPVMFPLMPGYSLEEVPVKGVFEPNLSQQPSINWPTLQIFPPLNIEPPNQATSSNFGTNVRKLKGKKLKKPEQVGVPATSQSLNSMATAWRKYSSLKEAILKVQQSKLSPILTNSLSYLYSNLPKAIWNYKRPPKEHKQMNIRQSEQPILSASTLFPSSFAGGIPSIGPNILKNLASNLPLNLDNYSSNSATFNKPVLRHRNLPAIEDTIRNLLNAFLENIFTIQPDLLRLNSIADPFNLYSTTNTINSQILDLLSRKSSSINRLGSDMQKRKSSADYLDQPSTIGNINTATNIRNKPDDGLTTNTCNSRQSTNAFALIPFPIIF